MKRYPIFILICLCLLCAGCMADMMAAEAGGVSLPPAPAATQAPDDAAPPPLTPTLLMDALISKGELLYAEPQIFDVRYTDIADVLEGHGEAPFSAFLRRQAGNDAWLRISDEALLYEGAFSSGPEDITFAVILFNGHRNGYGLVMENRDGWRFAGYFECGEVETSPESSHSGAPEQRVDTYTAELMDDGSLQTWLRVPGHVDSGTGRAAYDCTWYNLTNRRVDVRYITETVQHNAPFCYRVTGEARAAQELSSGGYALEIDYSCRFAVAPEDFWEGLGEEQNDIVIEKTEYFIWQDGGMLPVSPYRALYNQEDVSPGTLMDLCWDQFHRLEKRGTRQEKKWAEQIRQLNYDAMAEHITIENIYGDRQDIGQRNGEMQPQEFSEMRQLAPTVQTPGGAPVKLAFIQRPDQNFTLTRYLDDGSTAIIPVDNGMFNAPLQKGAAFYTLETSWFFGRYIYGFELYATEDGEAFPCLSAEETAAIERARGYLQQITGYDFTHASATAELRKLSELTGSPDEWDVSLLLPHQNMAANVRFELDGQMTFYALWTTGATDDPDASLPLLPQPTETEALSYTEKAGYWFEKLPIKRMGETRVIELAAKNRPGQYENSPETITKQRFVDGSVLTSHFDQKMGRLTYFCLYPAELLKGN